MPHTVCVPQSGNDTLCKKCCDLWRMVEGVRCKLATALCRCANIWSVTVIYLTISSKNELDVAVMALCITPLNALHRSVYVCMHVHDRKSTVYLGQFSDDGDRGIQNVGLNSILMWLVGQTILWLIKHLCNKIQSVEWDGTDIWKWANVDLNEEFNNSGRIKDASRWMWLRWYFGWWGQTSWCWWVWRLPSSET